MTTDAPKIATTSKEKSLPPSKVVVRHLPPMLSEENFHDLLQKLCGEHLEFFWYRQGKARCVMQMENVLVCKCMPVPEYSRYGVPEDS